MEAEIKLNMKECKTLIKCQVRTLDYFLKFYLTQMLLDLFT